MKILWNMNLNYENEKRLWLSVSFTLRNSTHKVSLLCIVGCNNDIECVGKQILKNRLELTLSVRCFGHFKFYTCQNHLGRAMILITLMTIASLVDDYQRSQRQSSLNRFRLEFDICSSSKGINEII